MSEDTPKPTLSLVRSFRASDYKHHEFMPFNDPFDAKERSGAMSMLRGYMQTARLTDYGLFESRNGITLSLRNDTDLSRFAIARMEDMEIEAYYFTAHPDYSTRSLRYRMKKLQEIAETSGFSGKLFFGVDPDRNAIVLNADCKKTYFDFLEFAKDNQLRAKFFKNVPLPEPKNMSGPAVMLEIMDQNCSEGDYPPEDYDDEDEIPSSKGVIDGGANDKTATAPTGNLSLVSSFDISNYIYSFANALDDPQDGAERDLVMRKFRGTVEIAGIKDFKLIEGRNQIELYLRTPEDVNRFNVVRNSGDRIEEEFVQFEDGFDFRKIKRLTRHLQSLSDAAGFGDTILFGAARNLGGIVIMGSPKKAYFEFADYVQANQDKFLRFFALQRKEPELQIAEPTRQNYAEPRIMVESDDKLETNPREASERFIRGGATDETVTAPTGKASIAAAYDENIYKFKLNMSLGYNPEMNSADRLFQHDPDYPAFKIEHGIPKRVQQIHTAMQSAGVEDYFVYSKGNEIHGRFLKPQDLAVAVAAISPDASYMADFVQCSQNASPMKMNKKAKKLQAIFAECAPDLHVQFVCDKTRNVICVKTGNSDDFIRTQGVARKLETSSPLFQRIVGLN